MYMIDINELQITASHDINVSLCNAALSIDSSIAICSRRNMSSD